MCHYKMPTCKFLEDVQCPVTVFSMDRDDSRMKQFLKKNDQIIMVKENSELELSKSKVFEEKMYAVLKDTTTLLN